MWPPYWTVPGREEGRSVEVLVNKALRNGQTAHISAVTASELLHGFHRAEQESIRKRRFAFIEDTLKLFPILPFDLEVAREHARAWADLSRQGMFNRCTRSDNRRHCPRP